MLDIGISYFLQISYKKVRNLSSHPGMTRFELATPRPPDVCATGLRYIPKFFMGLHRHVSQACALLQSTWTPALNRIANVIANGKTSKSLPTLQIISLKHVFRCGNIFIIAHFVPG